MIRHHIDKDVKAFADKNISVSSNSIFSISMILLVLVSAGQTNSSITATAGSPDADSVFYRIDTSIRGLEDQFWKQGISFLRRKKKKLAKVKCYLTVDETYESYTGKLHKKPVSELSTQEKTVSRYIHGYKPKKGDTGSFKYLVFALVYGKKRHVLHVRALKRKEKYWLYVANILKLLYGEVKYECALLDRGFYVAELVDQLNKDETPFIIRAQLCDEMKKIYGIYREWKSYAYEIADWAATTLILGRDFRNRPWGFVTNMNLKNLRLAKKHYKNRWNIENIFKATDGIQLRAATSNHVTRLFCVCLSFLIYNAWQNRNRKPTLLDHMKQFFKKVFVLFIKICPYRDRFRLNLPLWDFLNI